MMALSSAELTAIFVQAVIVLVIVRRSYAMTQGVPYSGLRIAVLPGLLLLLWVLNELDSLVLIPWSLPYLIVLDVAVLVTATVAFTPVAARMTTVSRDARGGGTIRIGFSLAALFVGVFVLRTAVAIALFPSSLEFGSPTGGFPPFSQQIVLAVIDAMFSFSAGLALARSAGIRRKWSESATAVPTAAPP